MRESHKLDDKWGFSRNGSVPPCPPPPPLFFEQRKNHNAESFLDLGPLVLSCSLFDGIEILYCSKNRYLKLIEVVVGIRYLLRGCVFVTDEFVFSVYWAHNLNVTQTAISTLILSTYTQSFTASVV